jgi:DNA primase
LAAHIPEEKINQVKQASDIVAVIGESVLLKKRGKNYLGLCPFHDEKTPSFTVSPDKQLFHCFGCGEGGSVFRFLMQREGLSFPQAVRRVARQHGIDLPDSRNADPNRPMSQSERLLRVNKLALSYYEHCFNHPQTGRRARQFIQMRGFSDHVREQFQLGFAPPGWDNLSLYLKRRGIPTTDIESAGLGIPRKRGDGHYDRFRDRIMFPICQTDQRVIGFGGRVLDDGMPKYMNSPETPVYHKSKSLYGLHAAKIACRNAEAVFIVEGYFDLLAMHQHGFRNSVATLGTALTTAHVKLLKSFIGANGTAVLLFDADEAGIKAAKRSLPLFDQSAIGAKVLVLPPGHDPDSFLKENGPAPFEKLAANADDAISFLIKEAQRQHGDSIEGRLRTIETLLPIFKAVADPVRRTLYVNHLADRIDVAPAAVLERIRSFRMPTDPRGRYDRLPPTRDGRSDGSPLTQSAHAEEAPPVERLLVAMMLQYPEGARQIRTHRIWDFFENPVLKRIAEKMNPADSGAPLASHDLLDRLDDEARNVATGLALMDEQWTFEGCRRLILQYIETQRAAREKTLIRQIKAAEAEQDHTLLIKLLSQKQRLAAQHQMKRKHMAQGRSHDEI